MQQKLVKGAPITLNVGQKSYDGPAKAMPNQPVLLTQIVACLGFIFWWAEAPAHQKAAQGN